MNSMVVVFSLLSVVSCSALFAVWRQNFAIQSTLAESRLVNTEFLRLLANTHATAKLMLEACPLAELSNHCASGMGRLGLAVAAVDEFARSSESPRSDP